MTTHLVIPDSHVTPGITNARFEWAARLVLDRRPDVIVCLGDFADMASLCSYDRGKKAFEGRRYSLDIEACKDALERFNAPIEEYNSQRRKNGKAQYRPRKVMLLGNHEERINRATNISPELEGTIGINDLGFESYGWEVHRFLVPVCLDGIYYSHYFVTGVSGEAISGVNPAASIIAKQMESSVAGHSHIFDTALRNTPSGRTIHGLVAGCFFSHKQEFAWSTEHLYWRGLCLLNDVRNGSYDLETIKLERLERMYGGVREVAD